LTLNNDHLLTHSQNQPKVKKNVEISTFIIKIRLKVKVEISVTQECECSVHEINKEIMTNCMSKD